MKQDNEFQNDFERDLLKRGYKIYKANSFDSYQKLFQKRFDDDKGIKYFITIEKYDFGYVKNSLHYNVTAQFHFEKERKCKCVNLQYSADFLPNEYREVTSIEEFEQFFEDFFKIMKPEYYELF